MHKMFYEKNKVLSECYNTLPPRNKKQLTSIIQNLIKRRQQHQARIQKLVSPNYLSKDITQQTVKPANSQFSRILEQLDKNEAIVECTGNQNVGAFGSHVNLLATVSLKTDYHLCEQTNARQIGQLQSQIRQKYSVSKTYASLQSSEQPQNVSEGLRQTVDYLVEEGIANDIFVTINVGVSEQKSQFYGSRFSLGKYQEIHLSKESIKNNEESLVLLQSSKDDQVANISWLLLKRLLSSSKILCFPNALHTLFSYPIKSFDIRQSLQLLQLNELIGEIYKQEEESLMKVYGVDEKDGYSYQITNLSKSKSLKYYKSMLSRFNKMYILNQEELPFKHIPLSCLQNHFVVVTMTIVQKDEYFISVGQTNHSKKYRMHIFNQEGTVVHSDLVKNGEFSYCRLVEGQYEVYISPVAYQEHEGICMEQSYELVREQQENFSMWVQGKNVYSKNGELNLEIRLRQDYNHYTMKIAKNYLEKLSQSKKQIQDFKGQGNGIIVKRQILESVNLIVDTFLFEHQIPLTVTYKGTHMLTDNHFQHSTTTTSTGKSLVLYHKAEIDSISINSGTISQKVDFSLVEYYL